MFNYRKKQLLLFFFLLISFYIKQDPCSAVCEVVKAKTIVDKFNQSKQYEDFEIYEGYEFESEDSKNNVETALEKKIKSFFNKRRKKQDPDEQALIQEDIKEDLQYQDKKENDNQDNEDSNVVTNNENYEIPNETFEVDDRHKFQINADKVTYDDKEGNVYANGNVEIIAKVQDVILKADNAVLDKTNQQLKLTGDVTIIKDKTEMKGQSMLVDLNEQNILMDNPTLEAYSFIVNAQEGFLIENDIQMLNGTIKSARKTDFPLVTRGFMRLDNITRDFYFDKYNFPESDKNEEDSKKHSYRIDAKEIVITTYKEHNSVLLKGSNIFYNNHKIVKNADLEIISDKPRQIVETNAPEAGNLRNFGSYIGYGLVYKLPKGNTFKFMPVAAYSNNNVGIGAIGRLRSKTGVLEAGWNTASENLVVRGNRRISDSLSLSYGRNAYMTEGFMGSRRSGYAAQLQYQKSYKIPDLKANFSNGVYAGIFSDYSKHDQEDAYSTTRFRYMAQLSKDIFRYRNKEQDFMIAGRAIAQGAATVYGSGEIHGIVRLGPTIATRYKRWESSLGYTLSGTHGDSPFWFDKYRYGKSTIMLNEKFHFSEKFALGFRMFVTPLKDNPEEDLLTECRFYVIAGPKDAKIALSYDFVRDVSHMDLMFLIGSETSRINFEKLTTQDIEGKVEKRDFYKNAKPIKIEKPESI